ncbi:MAG TPA: hypothetical protein VF473_04960 [Cyclobacteriaceae bacterium]
MKFVAHVIVIMMISLVMQLFLPWWTMAVGAFATGLVFRQSGLLSFLAGLLGVGLLWFGMADYLHLSTNGILSEKVAAIFPTQTVGALLLVTGLIGGLVGGFASMTGGLIVYRKRHWY